MPRPGPRPYECVRRAWHSDRHQPIRGTVIQQIFRLVTQEHSSATKKNKEYEEKLPIVVFKAEEIMYSKANSEAEYMNTETLWDRVNDAIDTIIRKDESTESGQLLPPCVEAALTLGCVAVRASRSQRHVNPTAYLNQNPQVPASTLPKSLDRSTTERCPQLSPVHSSNQLNIPRGPTNPKVNSVLPVSPPNPQLAERNTSTVPLSYPFLHENGSPSHNVVMRTGSSASPNVASAYPVFYGSHYQLAEPQAHAGPRVQEETDAGTIIVGTPVGTSAREPAVEDRIPRNPYSYSYPDISCKRVKQIDSRVTDERQLGTECDLSLRLGPPSNSINGVDGRLTREPHDHISASSLQEGGKLGDALQGGKKFCFLPAKTIGACASFGSSAGRWLLECDGDKLEASAEKLKAPFADGQVCWRFESPSSRYIN